MPIYDYECAACGTFAAMRPMAEFAAPCPCAGCGRPATRVILSAPHLGGMDAGVRRAHATNERSADAPSSSRGAHPPGCGCCRPGRTGAATGGPAAAKSFPAARPWMISH